jgi:hypothetical protein
MSDGAFGLRPSSKIPKSTEIRRLDLVKRLMLALSNGTHKCGALYPFIWGWKQNYFPKRCVHQNIRRWTKSKTSVIPSVTHHRQNHVELIKSVITKNVKCKQQNKVMLDNAFKIWTLILSKKGTFSWFTKTEHTEETESEKITTRNDALNNRLFYTKVLQTTDSIKRRKC